MVVATRNGAQTPYNFPTQDSAQQFMQSLSGIDGVQLLKMQGSEPVQYDNQKVISGPPAKGKDVKPKLLSGNLPDRSPVVLNIPGLEWAGYCEAPHWHCYEFIGHYDALMALGCVEPHMLAVGISRKKQGEGFETQKLVNNRFRLELRRDFELDEAALRPSPKSQPREHDPISSGLREVTQLIAKFPKGLRADLSAGLCASGGNGWQLLQSFPWLAVRIFAFHDKSAVGAMKLARQGAKTRDIAEAVNVPMCFKRFLPKVTESLLKHHEVLAKCPNIVSHHYPSKIGYQDSWLTNFGKALSSGSEEFAFWVAVHWQDLLEKEDDLQTIRSTVCDLRDWVRACVVQSIGSNIDSVCHILREKDITEFIDRKWQSYVDLAEAGKPFNKEMSLQTVLKLSEEWHERQSEKTAADVEFPEEWYVGGTVGDFRIEPIRTAVELSRYAYLLHNCATGFARGIADGGSFFYVVYEGDELKAMLEISNPARAAIDQLKGSRNTEVSTELSAAVQSWWGTRKRPGVSEETTQPLALAS